MRRRFPPITATLILVVLAGCARGADEPPRGSTGDTRRYELAGTIVSSDATAATVTVEHEPIEGFMDGMTMPFNVRDRWVFGVAESGALLRATLVVDGEASWLEEIVITRPPTAGDARRVVIPQPQVGEVVPSVELVDQDGREFTLEQYRGGAFVFTFIYTRCPLPDYCPRMSENMERAHEAIRAAPERYGTATRLLSVSLDPEYDTPEVLRAYGLRYLDEGDGAFDRWRFASPVGRDLRALAEFAGVRYVPEEGTISHSLRTVVVDADGRVVNTHVGNSWPVAELLADLEQAVGTSSDDDGSAGGGR